jgi:hypothetical protein
VATQGDESASANVVTKSGSQATRGPTSPFISLQEAVARAQKLYNEEGRAPAAAATAVKHWGYSEKSSGGRQTISALLQYGLVGDEGTGEQRKVSLTKRALDILMLDKDSHERGEAIRIASSSPKLFGEVLNRYAGTNLPSNSSLKHYLVSERELAPAAADLFIKNFRANLDYVKINNSGKVGDANPADETKDEGGESPKPDVGDLIQWESNGELKLESPRRVRAIQEHEGSFWIFVEGSTTGIPMNETAVIERAAKPPGPPPPVLPEVLHGELSRISASEREWLRGPLSKEAAYRLLVTGELGSRELGKLIKLLEAQKLVLDDDD